LCDWTVSFLLSLLPLLCSLATSPLSRPSLGQVNYVVQEAIVVIKDIFRKYPNQYEGIIGTLCENLDTLDEPEAKAAMIWIVGACA
jgi:hypothetical protein